MLNNRFIYLLFLLFEMSEMKEFLKELIKLAFGPMIVAIAHNENLFIENNKKVEENLATIIN